MYEYQASLQRVVDGDTVYLRVDCGFRIYAEMSFRLLGINAPEMSTAGGPPARDHLIQLMAALGPEFRITTTKADKYGRWLVTIYPPTGMSINDQMVADGFAVPYMV